MNLRDRVRILRRAHWSDSEIAQKLGVDKSDIVAVDKALPKGHLISEQEVNTLYARKGYGSGKGTHDKETKDVPNTAPTRQSLSLPFELG